MSPPRSNKREKPEKTVRLTSGGARFEVELWPTSVNILRQRPAGKFVSIGRLTFRLHQRPHHLNEPGSLELNGSFTLEPIPAKHKTREVELELIGTAERLISEKHPGIKEVHGQVIDMRNLSSLLDVGKIFKEMIALRTAGGRFGLARKKHAQTAAAKMLARRNAKSKGPMNPPNATAKKKTTRKTPSPGPRRRR